MTSRFTIDCCIVRGHLTAAADYQRRSARFIENHDEPRSAVAFGDRVRGAAVVISSVPGLRFFHQGQFEGRTKPLPVHLGQWSAEPPDTDLLDFYERLLATTNEDVFHEGEWRLLDVDSAGDGSNDDLVAWQWLRGGDLRIVAVNLGQGVAQGRVRCSRELPGDPRDDTVVFEDQLDGRSYPWSRSAVTQNGLYVRLEKGAAHIFKVV
jgi:hypothetical protein